ncbi:MAG: alpha/beta fold hydrolase [Chloroflexi bacterium]|nr:alpha/beta fold hydrolase [Chloroflexota bacterium]
MIDALAAIPAYERGQVLQTVASDQTPLRFRYWGAPAPSDAVVYLHGIAGHSLWFSPAATRLCAAGFTVYGFDRRGSGLNKDDRGHLPNYRLLIDDIYEFVQRVRAQHPGRKVFLVAGCWGAKPGVVFAQRHGQLLDGLALVSPALAVRISLPFKDLAGVARNLPSNPRKYFEIPLQPEQYTNSPLFRAFIAADPDRLLHATARFFFETRRLDFIVNKVAAGIHVPVTVLQAGKDEIVDVEGLRVWFGKVASRDKSFKVYPEFGHILEFEQRRDEYVADLLSWLKARSTPPTTRLVAAGQNGASSCPSCAAFLRPAARFCGRCGVQRQANGQGTVSMPVPAGVATQITRSDCRIPVRLTNGGIARRGWLVLEGAGDARPAVNVLPEIQLTGLDVEVDAAVEPEFRLRNVRLRN